MTRKDRRILAWGLIPALIRPIPRRCHVHCHIVHAGCVLQYRLTLLLKDLAMSPTPHQEIELKLTIAKSDLPKLRKHPLLVNAPKVGTTQTLLNTYVDTPALTLQSRKMALRIRKQGRQWLQTVKCAPQSLGGLSSRPEWEQPYLNDAFDFSQVDAPDVRKLLEKVHADLTPVFTTHFRRETRLIQPDSNTEILLMIDHGTVESQGRETPLCEIELELVQGSPLALYQVGIELAASVPLFPENISKAQRGYALFLQQPLLPAKAAPSSIRPQQSPLEAFRTLAQAALNHWQANIQGSLHSEDPEFIHQLRVALRRLRSLLSLFRLTLPEGFSRHWSEQFKQLANQLGSTRDLDVMIEEFITPVVQASVANHEITPLLEAAIQARDQARDQARQHLRSADHGKLQLEFAAALWNLRGDVLQDSADVRTFARLQLTKLRKKVLKRGKQAGDLQAEALHELRIGLKQLRYALDFFSPLLPGKASKELSKAATELQGALGFLNDVNVMRARLHEWAGNHPARHAAGSFVVGWHSPRFASLRSDILLRVEKFARTQAPWKA